MVNKLLERLDGVRKSGVGYMAKCPVHEDRSPSLSVRETPEGHTLLKCFAGCDTEDILAALGLTFRDVMPERLSDAPPVPRRDISPIDVLRSLSHEANLVAVAACMVADHGILAEEDIQRVAQAAGRITAALDFLQGGRHGH